MPQGSVSQELDVSSKLSLSPARSPSSLRLRLGCVFLAGMWLWGLMGLESSHVGMGLGSGPEPPLSWVCTAAGGLGPSPGSASGSLGGLGRFPAVPASACPGGHCSSILVSQQHCPGAAFSLLFSPRPVGTVSPPSS